MEEKKKRLDLKVAERSCFQLWSGWASYSTGLCHTAFASREIGRSTPSAQDAPWPKYMYANLASCLRAHRRVCWGGCHLGAGKTENHKNPEHFHWRFSALLGKSLSSLWLKSSIMKMLEYILSMLSQGGREDAGEETREETDIHCAYMQFLFNAVRWCLFVSLLIPYHSS